jgi:hypothetical protein
MATWKVRDGDTGCPHAEDAGPAGGPAETCEDCLREGTTWVHLRRCLTCGHVGCCDSSPRRHARGHWQGSDHPVAASAEVGEHWAWCFPDEALLVPAVAGPGDG